MLVGGSEVKNSEKDKKKPSQIQSIATWVLWLSVYVGVMAKRCPGRVPSLATYMAQIVQASRQFKVKPWVE